MEYKVGDKVRIRSWNSMANEFGLDCNGDIYSPGEGWVPTSERSFCGTIHKISGKSCITHNVYYLDHIESYSFFSLMFDQSFKE